MACANFSSLHILSNRDLDHGFAFDKGSVTGVKQTTASYMDRHTKLSHNKICPKSLNTNYQIPLTNQTMTLDMKS